MLQCWSARRKATAIDNKPPKVRRREGYFKTVQIKPDIFTLYRCTSAELFLSCCESVVALPLANCNEHVAEANITAPAHSQRAPHCAQSSRDKSSKMNTASKLEPHAQTGRGTFPGVGL
jgi:hypothetical protein